MYMKPCFCTSPWLPALTQKRRKKRYYDLCVEQGLAGHITVNSKRNMEIKLFFFMHRILP